MIHYIRKSRILLVPYLLAILLMVGCSEDDSDSPNGPQQNIETEKMAIRTTYLQWSQFLIAQNFDGALALTIPGSNAYNTTQTAKNQWDKGWQFYDDIEHVEAWLTQDDLDKNQGEAVGNQRFYQYHPSVGEFVNMEGFHSSCRKVDGVWKIDGINSNLAIDWWR